MAAENRFKIATLVVKAGDGPKILHTMRFKVDLPPGEIKKIHYEKMEDVDDLSAAISSHSYSVKLYGANNEKKRELLIGFQLDRGQEVQYLQIYIEEETPFPAEALVKVSAPKKTIRQKKVKKIVPTAKPAKSEPEQPQYYASEPINPAMMNYNPFYMGMHYPLAVQKMMAEMMVSPYYNPSLMASPNHPNLPASLIPPTYFMSNPGGEPVPKSTEPVVIQPPIAKPVASLQDEVRSPCDPRNFEEFDDTPISSARTPSPPPKPKNPPPAPKKAPASFAAAAAASASNPDPVPTARPRKLFCATAHMANLNQSGKVILHGKDMPEGYGPYHPDYPFASKQNLFQFDLPYYYLGEGSIDGMRRDWCGDFPTVSKLVLIRCALAKGVQKQVVDLFKLNFDRNRDPVNRQQKKTFHPNHNPETMGWFAPIYAWAQPQMLGQGKVAACNIWNAYMPEKNPCKKGKDCKHPHICMWCGSPKHGAFHRNEETKINLCPINRRMIEEVNELHELGLRPVDIGKYMTNIWEDYKAEMGDSETEENDDNYEVKTVVGTPVQRNEDPSVIFNSGPASPVPNIASSEEFPAIPAKSPERVAESSEAPSPAPASPAADPDGFQLPKKKKGKKAHRGKNL